MKYINIVYEYDYDETTDSIINIGKVDILLVPDFVCNNLNSIVPNFFDWVSREVYHAEKSKHPEYWTYLSDGSACIGINSEHFVNWLNDNYFSCENQKSIVVKVETVYDPNYPLVEF